MATNDQYQSPPFGTESQETGLGGTSGGSKTNGQYADGVPALNIDSQSSPKLPGDVHESGQSFADNGTVAYTDPFSILGSQGSQTPQDHGSTGSAPEYVPVVGGQVLDTGLGSGTASAPAPGRAAASQSSPWKRAGA
jgi:hypothetical protein